VTVGEGRSREQGAGTQGAGTQGASVPMHPLAAWGVLLTASLGVLLAGAELMVVAIALPSIVVDFGGWTDLARASWIVNGYLLAFVVAMPVAGRAADLWGARRLYVVALLLFAAGSAGAALSRAAGAETGIAWLIAARVVQGAGGGALVPLSMTLASHLFAGRARSVALGVEGAATFVGMAVGPAYGAWVLLNVRLPVPGVDIAPWQWIFLLNVPIALLTLLLLYVIAGGIETPRHPARLDLVGAALASAALVAGVGAVSLAGADGWSSLPVLGGVALGVACLAVFTWYERRRPAPLVDLRLFADRRFSAANGVSLLTGYTLATAIIGGPVFVDRVLFAPDEAAASATALTALTVAIAAGAVLGGLLGTVVGERPLTALGVALSAAALWLALGWGTETELGRLVRDLALFGVGFGLTVSPRATSAVAAAGPAAYGVASAMLQITRTVGMSIGLALLTSIGQSRIDELSALINDPARRDALVRTLGHPEFVGVDPNNSLGLVALLETWSRGQAADVLRLVLAIALGVAVAAIVPALALGGGRSGRGPVAAGASAGAAGAGDAPVS
jgi:EmrB/QacA subfamily drug resistance transporter